jgi:signal transduction histidine kinase
MRGVARACFRASTALAHLTALAFFLCAPAGADAATALRVEAAALIEQPGGTFGVPDAVLTPVPGTWQAVALPHVLARRLTAGDGPDDIITAWYRLDVPEAARELPDARLRLYLPRWQTIGQIAVYADDRLVFRSGAGPVWNGFNHPLWLALDQAGQEAPRRVVIRIDHLRSAGSALSTVWLGDEAGLAGRHRLREWLQADLPYVASAAFLVIGLFALAVWAVRREAVYGLFFVSSVLFVVRCLHYHMGLEPLPIPEEWFGWLTVHSLSWLVFTVFVFGFRLHQRRYPWLERALVGVLLLATVLTVPPLAVLPQLGQWLPLAYLGMIAATIGMAVLGVWTAWRSGSRDAQLVALWNLVTIPAGVHDWLLQNYRIGIESAYLMPYTAIGLFIAFMFVVLRRYLGALRDSEQGRAGLAMRLAEREAELAASYAKLRIVENERLLGQERQRLMQDMHDGLGSSLMSALKAVERGAAPDVAQLLRECIDDLKLAIDSLEPIQADLLLLLATLRFRLGNRLEQAGLRLNWAVQDVPPLEWLDGSSALHLLRIVQEVLANAVKHSGGSELRLATAHAGGEVVVSISDNGCGFDALAAAHAGRGLANVQRRAQAIGAVAAWRRTPGGTLFELAMPLVRATPS